MSDLKRRIAKLEERAPDVDGLLPIDYIIAFLQWRDKGRPGRDESVPLAVWEQLSVSFPRGASGE